MSGKVLAREGVKTDTATGGTPGGGTTAGGDGPRDPGAGEARAQKLRSGGLREEEVHRIIHLKRNLDYSDTLIQYAARYRKIGWWLVAVNLKGEPAFDLDFQGGEEVWGPQVTEWGLAGQQVNLGVRTGAPSRLLVLEVHREESRPPFNHRGDWCSGCVAEVGLEREQHYYALPRSWQPPASFFLESFQIMVFGEGGLVLVPPSMEPRVQANLRWLRPPWETPPTRPSPALCRFLTENAPRLPASPPQSLPEVLPWAKIYPFIQSHSHLLQALLAPAPSPETYYRNLLREARMVGFSDGELLLGLLWHAPLGEVREPWEKLGYLKELLEHHQAGGEEEPASGLRGDPPPAAESSEPVLGPEQPPARLTGEQFGPPTPMAASWPPSASHGGGEAPAFPRNLNSDPVSPVWQEILRFSQENLMVERRRYEAMIYELGKLGALQDYWKKEHRQHRALRDKLESQWMAELQHLRQQLQAKKPKKGWYRSWWQE